MLNKENMRLGLECTIGNRKNTNDKINGRGEWAMGNRGERTRDYH